MGVFDSKQNTQLAVHLKDNRHFKFMQLPLDNSWIVEKMKEDINRGWLHFYSNELSFPGYKNMRAGMYTLFFDRDIILDLFNQVKIGEMINQKPDASDQEKLNQWIGRVAESRRHILRSKAKQSTMVDKIAWVLMGVLGIEIIVWALRFGTG